MASLLSKGSEARGREGPRSEAERVTRLEERNHLQKSSKGQDRKALDQNVPLMIPPSTANVDAKDVGNRGETKIRPHSQIPGEYRGVQGEFLKFVW